MAKAGKESTKAAMAKAGKESGKAAMAKAGKESEKAAGLEDELSCPICLSLYRSPMSLSCGHSFCKECIQMALNAQKKAKAPNSCPVCKLHLGPVPELQKNFQLCNIVEAFLATASKGQQDKTSADGKEEVVSCDYCLDLPQPAVKTCLICNASMCEAHVNKHNSKTSQEDHVLVDVGADGMIEERKCLEHGRLLECYCEDEEQCICMLCSIAGCHKGHSIISLKEAHDKELGKLWKTMKRLQMYNKTSTVALEELEKIENWIKTNTNTVTSQVQKLFEEVMNELIQKEKKIVSDIQSTEKEKLEEITTLKKKMEQSRNKIVEHLESLQKMTEHPDKFLFFKEFKLAKDTLANQDFHQNLCADAMDVMVVRLNQRSTDHFRRLMRDCLICLDSVLQDVHEELANQIKWKRRDSNPSSNSIPEKSSKTWHFLVYDSK